ncbi:glycosidase, partial [Vibrio metoecus]
MKHTLLIAATATALLAGCASTTEQTAPAATN